jgi:predicted nucleic acid-binding protein
VILVDTSVWVDHLRQQDSTMVLLLERGYVLIHPFVIGELALGSIPRREMVLSNLQSLPSVSVAADSEVLHMIHRHKLFGLGIGYVDVHLLAAAELSDSFFWTRDKRLAQVASRLSIAGGSLN